MKKHLTIIEALKSIIFLTPEEAKNFLQIHFPRDIIKVEIDMEGNTIVTIGRHIYRIEVSPESELV